MSTSPTPSSSPTPENFNLPGQASPSSSPRSTSGTPSKVPEGEKKAAAAGKAIGGGSSEVIPAQRKNITSSQYDPKVVNLAEKYPVKVKAQAKAKAAEPPRKLVRSERGGKLITDADIDKLKKRATAVLKELSPKRGDNFEEREIRETEKAVVERALVKFLENPTEKTKATLIACLEAEEKG